ncbi:MAG: hypothetical protein WBA77_21620 [Microcoleaceae cyanobacterium]
MEWCVYSSNIPYKSSAIAINDWNGVFTVAIYPTKAARSQLMIGMVCLQWQYTLQKQRDRS